MSKKELAVIVVIVLLPFLLGIGLGVLEDLQDPAPQIVTVKVSDVR